jgi:hypothetical protein
MPAFAASCTAPYQVWFGGHGAWEYLANNDFSCTTDSWFYDDSSKGSAGICSNVFNVSTYTRFNHVDSFARTYQIFRVPDVGEDGYMAGGGSTTWFTGFSYEKIGTGTSSDALSLQIYNNDTGSLLYASPQIHATDNQNCFNPAYTITMDLAPGTNVRVEIHGAIVTSGFSWKVTNVALQRKFS